MYIAPPFSLAELPLNVQFVKVGLLWKLHIPPACLSAKLPVNMQFVNTGLQLSL